MSYSAGRALALRLAGNCVNLLGWAVCHENQLWIYGSLGCREDRFGDALRARLRMKMVAILEFIRTPHIGRPRPDFERGSAGRHDLPAATAILFQLPLLRAGWREPVGENQGPSRSS